MAMGNNGIPENINTWDGVYGFFKGNPVSGQLFEEFCKYYYLTEPSVKNDYKNVWLFKEIPADIKTKLNFAKHVDYGVDLVLEDRLGLFTAVQCKFHSNQGDTLSWTKDKIANLFAEGDKADYFIVFTNVSGLDPHSIQKKAERFKLVTLGDLLTIQPETINKIVAQINGNKVLKIEPSVKLPRKDQLEAIEDVINGFNQHDRGQLILPCGAGKTLTALWLKERLNPQPQHTVVLVPSLALIRQIKNEWAENQSEWQPYLCVCSEKEIDKSSDKPVVHTYEIGGNVTTDPKEIWSFLSLHPQTIIYCTYQSLAEVAKAIKDKGFSFDLAICDEAHKTAGHRKGEFGLIHDNDKVPVKKRLYMTATPRIISEQVKTRLGEYEMTFLADMGDPAVYGPEFHRMSFKKAIELGILVDYKIIAIGVSDSEIRREIKQRRFVEEKGTTIEDYANNYALEKVMKKYGAGHAITFHSTIKKARDFTIRHQEIYPDVLSEHVSGEQSTNDRNVTLEAFKNSPKAVVTNARCLTEGVNVPTIDAVYFCDPKNSKVDIVQASGRALRKSYHYNKPLGFIVVPIFHGDDEDIETTIESGPFKNLINVVRALCDHDERIQTEINAIKLGLGTRGSSDRSAHITIDDESLLLIRLENFAAKLKETLFDQIIEMTADSWMVKYLLLKEYRTSHPDRWPRHSELFHDLNLGGWCSTQRNYFQKKTISSVRINLLDEIKFEWEPLEEAWNYGYDLLTRYRRENPNKWPRQIEVYDGFKLGNWCASQRDANRNKILEDARKLLLDKIGFQWEPLKDKWDYGYDLLRKYRMQNPGKWPLSNENYEGFDIGNWCHINRYLNRTGGLISDRKNLLDEIGFPWDPHEISWQEGYGLLIEYRKNYPNQWPATTKAIYKGFRLGSWVITQRHAQRKGNLSQKFKRLLDEIGFRFNPQDDLWDKAYALLKEYRERNPGKWPESKPYKGFNLAVWCQIQRANKRDGQLPLVRKTLLDAIEFPWEPRKDSWDEGYDLLKKYRRLNSDKWPVRHEVFEGFNIGNWCKTIRKIAREGNYPLDRKKKLDVIGFPWAPQKDSWNKGYASLIRFRKENPEKWPVHSDIFNGFKLGQWCADRRKLNREGSLSSEYKNLLDEIGFPWKLR